MLSCVRRAPLRSDPTALARRQPPTIKAYRKAVASFAQWCSSHGVVPNDPGELDDLMVEWKNAAGIAKTTFANALAGAELAIPPAKGMLTWSRSVLNDWEVVSPVHHHAPLPQDLALLIAVIMSALGYARLAAGLVIQQRRGLRPSELLKLRGKDVLLPEHLAYNNTNGVLNLGMRAGTKAKRAQAVLLDAHKHAHAMLLLRMLKLSTADDEELMQGASLATYQRIMARVCEILDIEVFTPHCARAGFATDAFLSGQDFLSIREEGRWLSDASLRVYLDAVSSSLQASSNTSQRYAAVMHELRQIFVFYFSWWPGCPLKQTRPLPLCLRALLNAKPRHPPKSLFKPKTWSSATRCPPPK